MRAHMHIDDGTELLAAVADDAFSVNSIDEMLSPDNTEQVTDAWKTELADRVSEILDRKRSSIQGRERCLAIYIRILTSQYVEEDISGNEAELVMAFLKSIKAESSEKETVLAIKGVFSILRLSSRHLTSS